MNYFSVMVFDQAGFFVNLVRQVFVNIVEKTYAKLLIYILKDNTPKTRQNNCTSTFFMWVM